MKCKTCGQSMRVLDTRDLGGKVVRIRRCPVCGRKSFTDEVETGVAKIGNSSKTTKKSLPVGKSSF